MDDLDLTGAVDLHCHFGSNRKRWSVNAFEVAREAAACGFAAIVLKSHTFPTAPLAWAVNQVVDGVEAVGSICCEHPVGGINPDAVEVALRGGARVVWLPTLSSQQDVDNGLAAIMGLPLDRGLRVDDDSGALRPETWAVIELVRDANAILATGHISRAEHFAVASACAADVKLVVTHAMEPAAGPRLTRDDCLALANLGCIIEFSMASCMGSRVGPPLEHVAAAIREVGPDRCVLSSDLGVNDGTPHPPPGLLQFGRALIEHGISAGEIRQMTCTTPAGLLSGWRDGTST